MWRPKAENQIRKSDVRQSERTKKNDNDVFPCDSAIRKVGDVRKLKRLANEKPQDDFERAKELQQEESAPLKADVFAAVGRVKSGWVEYQRKICQYIDYLREIVEEPPEVDDMNDLQRRQKRATGFSNRFTRNHLYPIGRIVRIENFTQFYFSYLTLFHLPSCSRRQKKFE